MAFFNRDDTQRKVAETVAGNINYTPDVWFKELRKAAAAAASTAFKIEIEKRIDYYYGRFKPYLEKELKKQFLNYKELKLQLQYVNAIRVITDELSVIYNWGANRELYRGDELIEDGDDPERQLWEWIMKSGKYDRTLRLTNSMVSLCQNALIRTYFWQPTGEIRLQVITPNNVDIIQHPDDPSEMVALYYATQPTDEYLGGSGGRNTIAGNYYDRTVWHYWDDRNYRRYVEGKGMIPIPENADGVNPYGVIPFAKFQNDMSTEGFWIDTGYDLSNAQDNINVKLTFLNYVIRLQSFSVPVLTGYEKEPGKTETIVIGAGKPITLPLARRDEGQPNFQFVTPSPAIDAIKAEINDEFQRLLSTYGLARGAFDATREAQSGYALRLKNTSLMERRQSEIPFYEDGEESLFQIIKKVWNTHADSLPADHKFKGAKFSEDTELRVTIPDPKLPDSPQEEQARWEFLFANKLATPINYLMEKEHLTEAEAEARWEKIKAWNDENKPPAPSFGDSNKFKNEPPETAKRDEKPTEPEADNANTET